MNPKLEILLTYLTSIFALIATIRSYHSNLLTFTTILLMLQTLIWFISALLKSYKYKKYKKIY